ncbi:zinc finger protein [Gracilaria domingensis]|nr:zinc finger protein [Gracilaria domingensis]
MLTSLYDPFLTTPPQRDTQVLSITVPPQPQPPPHLQRVIASELSLPAALFSSPPSLPLVTQRAISPCQSSTMSQPKEQRARPLKRKRSLQSLRAAAQHNAPEVNMNDEELLAIREMNETDEQINQSRAVYLALEQLKQALAVCNARIKSLHVESSPDNDLPFDFIVSKPAQPASRSSPSQARKRPASSSSADTDSRPSKRSRSSSGSAVVCPARVTCVVCRKTVADMETLVRHFRHAHQDLKPYSCTRCGGLYATENTMWAHLSNVHPAKPRKFKCGHCDASFDQIGAKTRHEHATHNMSKLPYVCSYEGCNLGFKFPAHLETHAQRTHPNFRPFRCSTASCSKRFPNLNGLNRHEREVHEKRTVYRCDCGKLIPKRDHLKRHLLNVHKMSPEQVKEEMKKHPHPGILNLVSNGPGPFATTGSDVLRTLAASSSSPTHAEEL